MGSIDNNTEEQPKKSRKGIGGKKTAYDPETFPALAEQYARQGFNDLQIAQNLGIKKSAYYDYQVKYPEFADAIRKGKKPVDQAVENALLKRALGYEFEEVKTETRKDIDGKPYDLITKTIKHIPGSEAAQIFWVINRMPDRWRQKQYIDGNEVKQPDLSGLGFKELYELKHGKKYVKGNNLEQEGNES